MNIEKPKSFSEWVKHCGRFVAGDGYENLLSISKDIIDSAIDDFIVWQQQQSQEEEIELKGKELFEWVKADRETLMDFFNGGYNYRSSKSPEIIEYFGENAQPDFETFLSEYIEDNNLEWLKPIQIQQALPLIDKGGLFIKQDISLHSGGRSDFKIECDSLTDLDLECIAYLISKKIQFGAVMGVPKGGIRLQKALEKYDIDGNETLLICDDVLTTGKSMEDLKNHIGIDDVKGVVIFARGICPDWVTPIFQMKSPSASIKPIEAKEQQGNEAVELKNILREFIMRANYAFPMNEQDLDWFDSGTKNEDGADFLLRLMNISGLEAEAHKNDEEDAEPLPAPPKL